MPTNKNQMARMVMILEMIKNEDHPNSTTIMKRLMALEDDTGSRMNAVSKRTVLRDIRELRDLYKAPIEYDPERNGYFIRDPEWSFDCAIFGEEQLINETTEFTARPKEVMDKFGIISECLKQIKKNFDKSGRENPSEGDLRKRSWSG